MTKDEIQELRESGMINLLEETIDVLNENNKTVDDVIKVVSDKGYINWNTFARIADKVWYEDGFGVTVIQHDLVILGKDWWLERFEYDGEEHWVYKSIADLRTGEELTEDIESMVFDKDLLDSDSFPALSGLVILDKVNTLIDTNMDSKLTCEFTELDAGTITKFFSDWISVSEPSEQVKPTDQQCVAIAMHTLIQQSLLRNEESTTITRESLESIDPDIKEMSDDILYKTLADIACNYNTTSNT